MKVAFLFAGQGSQSRGMGTALLESCAKCRELFTAADHVLGFPLSRLLVDGTAEELRKTEITQPALLTLCVAQAKHLRSLNVEPNALLGHSIGQYSALVTAHAISFEDALRLVRARGQLMKETVPDGAGAMAAIIGPERARVYEACLQMRAKGIVDVACHNAPGQTIISGEKACVAEIAEKFASQGEAAVPLDVSRPFHTTLLAAMLPAFAKLVKETAIHHPIMPVIDNVTALPLTDPVEIRRSLIAQVTKPVLFEEGLRWLFGAGGITKVIHCGPGNSLLGFAHRVQASSRCETFEEATTRAGRR
jgi:[acyl-carrier-protein] S-malonyltransferase